MLNVYAFAVATLISVARAQPLDRRDTWTTTQVYTTTEGGAMETTTFYETETNVINGQTVTTTIPKPLGYAVGYATEAVVTQIETLSD